MTTDAFQLSEFNLPTGVLQVRSAGAGRPVVHIHSAAGPRESPMMQRLSARHLILAPVVPGFDGSPRHAGVASVQNLVDLLAGWIAKVAPDGCDIIGESFGGYVAMWLALRHPGLVGQMVLEAPAGLREAGMGGLPSDPIKLFRKLYAVPKMAPVDTRTPAQREANRETVVGYFGATYPFDHELAGALPRIAVRTLILMGSRDEIVPPQTGHLLKARMPHAMLTYIYGAAHGLEWDAPERVANIIGDFLERGESFLVREVAGAR